MYNNRQTLLIQENKRLKEKVNDLETIIEMYQNKDIYSKKLIHQLNIRVNTLESLSERKPDNIRPMRAIKGGKSFDVTEIELLDGI